MHLRRVLRFCPRCGAETFRELSAKHFSCQDCRFDFFINPAVAAAAIVVDPTNRILLIRRAREPARGKLAMPGGFVDANETAEHSLRRELDEEIGLDPGSLQYFFSYPNEYHYQGTTYDVLDLYFIAHVQSLDPTVDPDEVESCVMVPVESIDLDEIAFPSMREALRHYCAHRSGSGGA